MLRVHFSQSVYGILQFIADENRAVCTETRRQHAAVNQHNGKHFNDLHLK
jgi:hypothetical protein